MPSTTGSTASRWLGFDGEGERRSRGRSGERCVPVAPRWYFTSPEPCAVAGVELALELAEDLVVATCRSTFDEHVQPAAVGHAEHDLGHAGVGGAGCSSASSIGMSDSAPSRLKRFCPRYFVWRNPSNASAAFSRSRMRRWSAAASVAASGERLDVLLDPLLLLGLLDVHVLDADGARRTRRAARRGCRAAAWSAVDAAGAEAADRELAVEVPDAEAVVADVELGVGVRARGGRAGRGSRCRWPRTRYMLMSWWTWTTFSFCVVSGRRTR